MLTGAYSQKFKDLEQGRLSRSSSSDSLSHAQQLAARDKVRQLSLETNRRRRAQELKRRLEAQKEANRRQEVLEERRRRQQEATQKYQRGQRVVPKTGPRVGSGKSYSDSRLQDGVNMARGYGQNASYAGNHSNRAPALEEALRMVGANTAPASSTSYRGGGYGGGADYSTVYRGGYSDSEVTYNRENSASDVPYRRPVVDTNGNAASDNKGHSYHGYPTTATATCNTNANRDAAGLLFQQTLHEQQRQLVEQQRAALSEFNQAVLSEALPSQGEEMQRSSSLSSLDSLEEEQPKSRKTLSKSSHVSGKPRTGDRDSAAGADGTLTNTVQTSANGRTDTRLKEPLQNGTSAMSDKFFTSQTSSQRQQPETAGAHSRGMVNGELLVEETSESDFVREPVETTPMLLQGSRELPPQHQTYGAYSTRVSQAWAPKTTPEGPQFHHAYDASHSPLRYSTGPVSVQAGHQPFSARTTATAVSSYPARLPDPLADYGYRAGQQAPEQETIKTTVPNTIPTRTVNFAPANTKNSSGLQEEESSRRDNRKRDETLETPEKTVKSILKRGQGNNIATTQKVKLGGFKVKDSLEISRATQVNKSDRKSVRWTDLNYVEEEDQAEVDRDPRLPASASGKTEKSKSSLRRPDDDAGTVQAETQRQVPSSGPPRRGPTKLQRKASKPPLARSNPGNSGRPVETENSRTTSRASGKILNHQQQEPSNKYAAVTTDDGRVYQNGIRLDKTPTDDEINWLWDKVRTCLNTQEQTANGSEASASRQPASVSKQCIDGNRLTASLRVPVPPPDHPLTSPKKYNTYPRFRTNSESSSTSLRKTALLHQRRQHSAAGNLRPGYQGRSNQHCTGLQPSPPTSTNHHQPGPPVSSQGPMRTAGGVSHGQDHEVSDSLLTFQHAEHLAAQENLSESDIAVAMEQPKNNAFMQKAPTALSMEEQRILASLDKLNAQLRTVTSDTNAAIQPFMMMQPKPPPQGSGFRSQRPISARQKAVANSNISHRTRTLSADRSNARINYYQ